MLFSVSCPSGKANKKRAEVPLPHAHRSKSHIPRSTRFSSGISASQSSAAHVRIKCKSFYPAAPPTGLDSRWRLCRLTDVAYPLRVKIPLASPVWKFCAKRKIYARSEAHLFCAKSECFLRSLILAPSTAQTSQSSPPCGQSPPPADPENMPRWYPDYPKTAAFRSKDLPASPVLFQESG